MVLVATFAFFSFLRSLCFLYGLRLSCCEPMTNDGRPSPFSFSVYVVVPVSKVLRFVSISTLFQSPFCFSLAVSYLKQDCAATRGCKFRNGNVDDLEADGC